MSPLTIAIPFYRNLHYIAETIASVRAQSTPEWQLIVSDGGGLPNPQLAELVHSQLDARITYQPAGRQLGIAEHWNRCLELAKTELVTLLHDDDRLHPDYTKSMLTAREQYPHAAFFFCEANVIDDRGESIFSLPDHIKKYLRPDFGHVARLYGNSGLHALMRGNFIMCPTICWRRTRVGARRFRDEWRQVLDLDMIARLLLDGEELIGLPQVLYEYRRHRSNTTAIQTETLVRYHEESAIFDQIAREARERHWRRAAEASEQKMMIRLNLLYRLLLDTLRGRTAAASAKGRLLLELSGFKRCHAISAIVDSSR